MKSEISLTLTDAAYLGSAIGRDENGRVVFVPYGIPGEVVKVKLTETHKRWATGEIIEIIQPAEVRVSPRCRHFGTCGGCHYQHMPYPLQLQIKRSIVRNQLERIGQFHDPPVLETVPSPSPWNVRNHLQFSLNKAGKLGFRKSNSKEIVPIEECHLPNQAISTLWPLLEFDSSAGISRVALRTGSDDEAMVIISGGGEPNIAISSDIHSSIIWTDSDKNITVLAGEHYLQFSINNRLFRVSANSFFQTQTEFAEQLVEHVIDLMQPRPGDRLLELYAGVGLFSAFLAEDGAVLTAVEQSRSACHDFEHNLIEFDHVTLYQARVEETLAFLSGPFDAVLLDPPRSGLGSEVTDQLSALNVPKIVYVSCDPTTMARDGKQLSQAGYRLEKVTPFDFFPQTYHIETVSLWSRTPAN